MCFALLVGFMLSWLCSDVVCVSFPDIFVIAVCLMVGWCCELILPFT